MDRYTFKGVRKVFCQKHFLIRGLSQKLAFLGLAADLKAKNQKFLDIYTFKGVRKLFCQKHFSILGPSQKLAFLGLAADLKAKNQKF